MNAMNEKRFAVLVPLIPQEEEVQILLMKRPERETDPYSGQVCFPGGALEKDDCDMLDCALRESTEELGIPPEAVEIIAELDWQQTGFQHAVKPYVGWIEAPLKLKPNPAEVDKVLYLPARRVKPGLFRTRGHWVDPHGREREILSFQLSKHEVWGLTARILEHCFISGSAAGSVRQKTGNFPPHQE